MKEEKKNTVEWRALLAKKEEEITALQRQVDWLSQQLRLTRGQRFGASSEQTQVLLMKWKPWLHRKQQSLTWIRSLTSVKSVRVNGIGILQQIVCSGRKLQKTGPDRSWAADDNEIRILRDNYSKSGVFGVQELLPNRSSTACSNMALRLGLTAKQSKEAGDHVNEDATAYAVTPPQIVEELDETQQDQNESAASQFGMM